MNNKIIVQRVENDYNGKTYTYNLITYDNKKILHLKSELYLNSHCFYHFPGVIISNTIVLEFNLTSLHTVFPFMGAIHIIEELDLISINDLYTNNIENNTFNGKIILNILELIMFNYND
jgi:hypothetical protein